MSWRLVLQHFRGARQTSNFPATGEPGGAPPAAGEPGVTARDAMRTAQARGTASEPALAPPAPSGTVALAAAAAGPLHLTAAAIRQLARLATTPLSRRAYLAAFALSLAMLLASFYSALLALAAIDRLPPPPISGTQCIDAKLAWLRANPQHRHAGVVAVGSSVTARNIDFEALPEHTRAAVGGLVNASPCFLFFNQTRFLTTFLLDHQPATHTVMTVVSPRDFEECTTVPAEFFDARLTASYLYGRAPAAWIYFRNFRPLSFLRDVKNRDVFRFGSFGEWPLTAPEPRILDFPGRVGPFVPQAACYDELTALARELERRGVRFVVVTFPVMPAWAAALDPEESLSRAFRGGVHAALAGTHATLVDGMGEYRAPSEHFTDPLHFQWSQAAGFTRWAWQEARRAGLDLPPP